MRLQEPLGRSLKFTPLTKMGKQSPSLCDVRENKNKAVI